MKHTPEAALLAAGLTAHEATVWSTLADRGPLNVSEISRHTSLHRPGVYAALRTLVNSKLIVPSKGSARVTYRATGAATLTKSRASNEKALNSRLQRMLARDVTSALPENVRVYQGVEIRKVWEEIASLPKNTVFYRYDGYSPELSIKSHVPQVYLNAIKNKHLERFVITNESLRAAPFIKRIECASQVLPGQGKFEQGISIFIYGDIIAMVDFVGETAFVVQNKALAAYQIELFKYLYNALPNGARV